MTIARDKEGRVVGQVTSTGYGCTPDGRATGALSVRLLTRDGYVTVPLHAVRLEEVSDN